MWYRNTYDAATNAGAADALLAAGEPYAVVAAAIDWALMTTRGMARLLLPLKVAYVVAAVPLLKIVNLSVSKTWLSLLLHFFSFSFSFSLSLSSFSCVSLAFVFSQLVFILSFSLFLSASLSFSLFPSLSLSFFSFPPFLPLSLSFSVVLALSSLSASPCSLVYYMNMEN
jgi:hypothetical protein